MSDDWRIKFMLEPSAAGSVHLRALITTREGDNYNGYLWYILTLDRDGSLSRGASYPAGLPVAMVDSKFAFDPTDQADGVQAKPGEPCEIELRLEPRPGGEAVDLVGVYRGGGGIPAPVTILSISDCGIYRYACHCALPIASDKTTSIAGF